MNMERILLKNVFLDDAKTCILIEDGKFKDLSAPESVPDAKVIDASTLAIVPAFYNVHTHAAMNLLRGYADDIALETWLNDYIWPFEAKLTSADVRRGSQMAVKEIVETGSVFMNDMYFDVEETIDEIDKAGIRAAIGITVMENHSKVVEDAKWEFVRNWQDPTGGRIQLVLAPHAIYTVGAEKLKKTASFARKQGLKLHTHLAETRTELEDCKRNFGTTPVRYLDSLGYLGPDVVLAHCIYVDDEEWDILAERGVTVVHCPCSNMKIASGRFPFEKALASGVRITLGTDGSCSNNNLDLREEAKFAALLAKVNGDPTLLPATEVLKWATVNGAQTFGINAGEVAVGREADFILLDMTNTRMQPCHNLISNWIYAADSSAISSVWCQGRRVK